MVRRLSPLEEARLHKADAAVSRLSVHTSGWAGEQATTLRRALGAYRARPSPFSGPLPGQGDTPLDSLMRTANDIAGVTAVAGYDLAAAIGRLICDYLRDLPAGAQPDPALLELQVAALLRALDDGGKPGGGAEAVAGRQVLQALRLAQRRQKPDRKGLRPDG
ncbi:MAG: hypothetical protein RLP96_00770 [Alphaproteobacteria bacterium]